MSRIWFYRLGPNHEIIPCEDPLPKDYKEIWDYENRKVGRTQVGPYPWSMTRNTVDTRYGPGHRPVLFETMVFDDGGGTEDFEHLERRYHTWDEAVAGHAAVVEVIRKHDALVAQVEDILDSG